MHQHDPYVTAALMTGRFALMRVQVPSEASEAFSRHMALRLRPSDEEGA